MNSDLLMDRCNWLAELGKGRVSPNPLVGSLVYGDGFILGEGYHMKLGEGHGEANAIKNAKGKNLAGASLYVNLEPCSHFGKTPPCTDLIIKEKIKSVYIATEDPNAVSGRGIEKLISNGVQVYLGVREKEAQLLNKRFFCFHKNKRPYIILKWVESKDGFIGRDEEKIWLSDNYTNLLSHKWRSEEDAILVGRKTFALDRPQLNTRHWAGSDPIRIVIDMELKNDFDDNFLENGFIVTKKNTDLPSIQLEENRDTIDQLCESLYSMNVQSVIIEGGSFTLQKFIEQNLWDEARIIKTSHILAHGVKSPTLRSFPNFQRLGNDDLAIVYNHRSL